MPKKKTKKEVEKKENKKDTIVSRDSKGRFLPGVKAPGSGKPEGSFSLKTILKNKLQEIEPKNRKTYAELLINKIIRKAIVDDGDFQQKLIFQYLEGMPKQTLEGSVDIKTALVTFIGGALEATQAEQLESGEEKVEESGSD